MVTGRQKCVLSVCNLDGLASFRGIKIDLDLYSNPQVKNHSLEVELDGKCYPAGNPDIR